jgi:hypothetical protein
MAGLSNQGLDLRHLRGTPGRNASRIENSGLKLTLKVLVWDLFLKAVF